MFQALHCCTWRSSWNPHLSSSSPTSNDFSKSLLFLPPLFLLNYILFYPYYHYKRRKENYKNERDTFLESVKTFLLNSLSLSLFHLSLFLSLSLLLYGVISLLLLLYITTIHHQRCRFLKSNAAIFSSAIKNQSCCCSSTVWSGLAAERAFCGLRKKHEEENLYNN